MDELNIYQRQELLEIYKNPSNRGVMANADVAVAQVNPMCGDEITLYLKFDGAGDSAKIIDAKFDGDACAVSVISSSMVTDELIGKRLGDVKKMTKKDVLDLIGIPLTTSRIRCATLVFEALEDAVKKYEAKKI